MEMVTERRKAGKGWMAAFLIAVFCTGVNTWQWLYTDVDNYYIAMVTNGILGADRYTPLVNPLLCRLAALLSAGFPLSDGYLLTVKAIVFCGYWWCAYRLLNSSRRKRLVGWLMLALVCAMCPPQMHYTALGALLSALGWLGLSFTAQSKRWRNLIPTIFFTLCGILFSWRSGVLIAPFGILVLLMSALSTEKGTKAGLLGRGIGCAVAAAILCGGLYVYQTWTEGDSVRFIRAERAATQATASYDSLQSPSFSWNDYDLIRSSFLADREGITTQKLEEIAAQSRVSPSPVSSAATLIATALGELRSCALLVSWAVLLLLLLCTKNSLPAKLGTLLSLASAIGLGIWLDMNGQLNENSCLILSIGMIFYIVAAIFWGTKETDGLWEVASFRNQFPLRRAVRSAAGCMLVAVIALGSLTWILAGPKAPQLAFSAREQLSDSFFQPENSDQFLWLAEDYNEKCLREGYFQEGKLPSEPFMLRNIPAGGWIYGCGAMEQYLKRVKAEAPLEKALEGNGTYIVASDISMVLQYIREHFGKGYSAWQVDTNLGVPVWMIQKK